MNRRLFYYLLCVLAAIAIFLMGHFTTIHYSLQGTYSAGNEPSEYNVSLALGTDWFELYNQKELLGRGRIENTHESRHFNIITLMSEENTLIGYVVQDKNRLILLNSEGESLSLKKVSPEPIVLTIHQPPSSKEAKDEA